jgi:hypothetical protein
MLRGTGSQKWRAQSLGPAKPKLTSAPGKPNDFHKASPRVRFMKKRSLLVAGVAVWISSCLRPAWPAPAPLGNDRSIVFPHFHDAVEVGAGATPYELDGVVLKAIMIAMNDYVRPNGREQVCWESPEAHRYRVIRTENIIFVRVDEDLEFCGLRYLSLDSGAEYAISLDGRILRRVFDGGLERDFAPDGGSAPVDPAPPDAGSSVPDGGLPNPP